MSGPAGGAVPGWQPSSGATGGTLSGLGDATSLSNTYQMTKADLNTPITFGGLSKNPDGSPLTIANVVRWFENLPPAQTQQWEQDLVDAGLQSATTVGEPQSRTDAFNSFLRFVAYQQQQNPKSPPDSQLVLDQLIRDNPGAAADKRGLAAAAKSVKVHLDLSNPLDVKQLGDAVANKLIGRDLTSQEAMAITSTIQSQQMASGQGELAQEQSLAAAQVGQGTGQGGLITTSAPTSAEAATTQYLTQHDPGDVQAHSLLNVFEAIKSKVETDAQGSGPRAATGPVKVI